MADSQQNIGFASEFYFAGDRIPINLTITTGNNAAAVSTATFALFDRTPGETEAEQTARASKSLGSGIAVTDGAESGVVVAAVTLDPGDTEDLDGGDYYYEMTLTSAGGFAHTTTGYIRLHEPALTAP